MAMSLAPLSRRLNAPRFMAGALLLLALAVRLPYLGSFMTIDEIKWIEGAGQFLLALREGDLAKTYWHFFPGITITWVEALLLWIRWLALGGDMDLPGFVAAQLAGLPQLLGLMRLSGVLITSVTLPLIYLLARRLLDPSTALLGAALLAVDPFFTAHSRIVNGDAITAAFMFLSMLAFLWLCSGHELRLAVISGVFGGLALLTKLPAPIIIPWIGLLALWGYRRQRSLVFWVQALLLWGFSAGLTFVLLWPAMWVAPVSTLQLMGYETFEVGGAGEGHDTFFLDQVSEDPGWLFYPVVVFFRLTPVVTLGFGLALLGLLLLRGQGASPEAWVKWSLLAYILIVIILASASPKKLDRYIMAVIPPLVFLAASGFTHLTGYLAAKNLGRAYHMPLLGALVTLQALFLSLSLPYYLTYYNPLAGGVRQAAHWVPAGWGEGLEQAAFWLNTQPGASNLRISAWYNDLFQLYFVGEQASFSDDGRAQLAADYVVFYLNQVQRQKPYPGLVDYFRAEEPLFVVAVNPAGRIIAAPAGSVPAQAIPWVEVYKAPAAQSASGAPEVEGVAQLLAYKIEGSRLAGAGSQGAAAASDLLPEDQLSITLFLRILGPLPQKTTIRVALANGEPWGRWEFIGKKGDWVEDHLVEWRGLLTLPTDMPAADYKLQIVFEFETGPVIAEFPLSDKDPPIRLK
jgi:4-amino-4-deoxy-L-arabinose transferase-like glycosyltransferase